MSSYISLPFQQHELARWQSYIAEPDSIAKTPHACFLPAPVPAMGGTQSTPHPSLSRQKRLRTFQHGANSCIFWNAGRRREDTPTAGAGRRGPGRGERHRLAVRRRVRSWSTDGVSRRAVPRHAGRQRPAARRWDGESAHGGRPAGRRLGGGMFGEIRVCRLGFGVSGFGFRVFPGVAIKSASPFCSTVQYCTNGIRTCVAFGWMS